MKIWETFKSFWDTRRPFWLGSEISLIECILTDPDFLEEVKDNC